MSQRLVVLFRNVLPGDSQCLEIFYSLRKPEFLLPDFYLGIIPKNGFVQNEAIALQLLPAELPSPSSL